MFPTSDNVIIAVSCELDGTYFLEIIFKNTGKFLKLPIDPDVFKNILFNINK